MAIYRTVRLLYNILSYICQPYIFACTYCIYLHAIYFIVIYSRTLAHVATVICWLYPTFLPCLILSYIMHAMNSWWRHQMETFSALLAVCAGNSPVTGEFPSQRPVTWSLMFSLICALNKRFSKQSWGWWFETSSRALWRHCNVHVKYPRAKHT